MSGQVKTVWFSDLLRGDGPDESSPYFKLTEEQQETLLRRLGKRCSADTKARLAAALRKPLRDWPGTALVGRLHIEDGHIDYCTGQDQTWEFARLRETLLRGY